MIKERRKKGMGEDAKTMKVRAEGRPGLRGREFRRLSEEMQEGWERCREAESKESGRCSGRFPEVQRSFQKCRNRETKRLDELQAEVQGGWKQCRRRRPTLAEEPGRMQEQEKAVNKAAQAPLVPMGAGLGHRLGSPQGRMGPRQLPTGRKVFRNAGQSPSLIHAQVDDAGGDDDEDPPNQRHDA